MGTPNYLPKILKLQAAGKMPPGVLSHAVILHDQWCAIYQGRSCDCNPDVSIHADGCPAVPSGAGCICGGSQQTSR